jgi:ADP-heptose:LPS heptosyltransferase
MAPRPFPILFITATRIGDAVLSSGLLKRLHDEIPQARFTIVAGAEAAPLFADTPGLDALIAFEKLKGGGHWFRLWRRFVSRRWGLIVDMRGSAISRFLRRRRRAVFERPKTPAHKVIEAARVLKLEDEPPAPFLFTSERREKDAARLTAGEGPILAVAPAAAWVGKTWPVERFAQVAMDLIGDNGPLAGGRLMLLGGPNDRQGAAPLRGVVPGDRLIDLVGKVDPLVAYACLKRARLFIGNDSGVMHLAAASGAPTLGLFGPSDEALYAPWGPRARALRGGRTFAQLKALDAELNQQLCHMMDLHVRTVSDAAKALLRKPETRPADA